MRRARALGAMALGQTIAAPAGAQRELTALPRAGRVVIDVFSPAVLRA